MALTGKHLRVAAGLWNPWVILEHNQEGKLVNSSGILIDFMNIFASKLNFTYKIVEAADNEWGRILLNGSTTGMIGLCQRKEVEMALGPFSITYVRNEIIDYSIPFHTDTSGIFLPRPTRETDLAGFVKPFAWQVWLALLLFVMSSMALGSCITWFLKSRRSPSRGRKDFLTILDFRPVWLIKLLLAEPVEIPHLGLTGRLFLGTWMLAALILSSAYQGILTSLLAVPRVNIPVDSLQDLLNYGKIPWANEYGTSLHQFFGDAESGIYKEINDGAFLVTACYDVRERIKKEKFAIFCDFFSMKKIVSDDFSETSQCNYYIAKEAIWDSGFAFAFPKHSPIISHFDRYATMLVESGMVNKYRQQFTANATACMVKPGKESGWKTLVLSLDDFGGIFLLFLGGLTFGEITLILETITYKIM